VEKPWSVERRFRVTEVFLAVLWVRIRCGVTRGCGRYARFLGGYKIGINGILKETLISSCAVLCVRLLVILFYGLSHVAVVSTCLT
jgi:hypothetical protein